MEITLNGKDSGKSTAGLALVSKLKLKHILQRCELTLLPRILYFSSFNTIPCSHPGMEGKLLPLTVHTYIK